MMQGLVFKDWCGVVRTRGSLVRRAMQGVDPEDRADPAMSLSEQLVLLALLLRLVSLTLILLHIVLLVPTRHAVSAPWRRLEDVRLPHQSTAEGRDMLTAMMTRAVCQRRTLWG